VLQKKDINRLKLMNSADTDFDIAIIGAGPAGLCACRTALSKDKKVVLIDKRTPWEHPIACAEGVGRLGFEEAIPAKKAWIRHSISKATFHSPDNTTVTYTDSNKGFIINRARMQHDIYEECMKSGATMQLNSAVRGISKWANGTRVLSLANGAELSARVVIDASGPSSPIGRDEKMIWKAADLEPAYFCIAENIPHDHDTVHLYVGRELAPGGYAWLFPGEENLSNIGLLVGHRMRGQVNIRELLGRFLAERFPEANVIRYFAGPIPCWKRKVSLTRAGLIKAGDAASTVNPISRAGIVESMHSGNLAGKYASQMCTVHSRSESRNIGKSYEEAWFKKLGKRHDKLAKVKNSLLKVPDTDYNKAAQTLHSYNEKKLTMAAIFRLSLGRFPRLVWAMRHLM